MAGTFISYRREDAAGYAGRLRESLERRLGAARVFRDVDTLRPGQDFVQAIEARLADCAVMLAVIGREWAGGARPGRQPAARRALRLRPPRNRRGAGAAQRAGRAGARRGRLDAGAGELPENLKPLARRHAVSVRDETWDADVDRLVNVDRDRR